MTSESIVVMPDIQDHSVDVHDILISNENQDSFQSAEDQLQFITVVSDEGHEILGGGDSGSMAATLLS